MGRQRVSLCSRARISAGVWGVSPAAWTASGNLTAEAEARQHREMLLKMGQDRREQEKEMEEEGPGERLGAGQGAGQRAETDRDMISTLNLPV